MDIQNALDHDQLRRYAPSIFAAAPHSSRSDQYTYVPTIDVLDALAGEGFLPVQANQTNVRRRDKVHHTKHLIRLRREDRMDDENALDVVLINSHDGSSSFQIKTGLFRFACANGLIVGESFGDTRIRHQGRDQIIDDVIEGSYEVVRQGEQVQNSVDLFRSTPVTQEQERAFAVAASGLRFDKNEYGDYPVQPGSLLSPRRMGDDKPNVWSVYNRVQENLIKGRVMGRDKSGRRTRTKPIKGIDQSTKLNRALWTLTEELQKSVA